MIRHGPSCMTGTLIAHWPTTQRVPIPELKRVACTATFITDADRGLTLHDITLITPEGALSQREHIPARTIPQPLYP